MITGTNAAPARKSPPATNKGGKPSNVKCHLRSNANELDIKSSINGWVNYGN